MPCDWKPNWQQTRQHFIDWWNRKGLVVGAWQAPPGREPHGPHEWPTIAGPEDYYADPLKRARHAHALMATRHFGADCLPMVRPDIGPGSLALTLGSEPGFSRETVWFKPTMADVADPESLGPLRFDPANRWWQVHEQTLRACVELADGHYMVGCPDLVENIDILAALRDPQTLMFDMLDRPAWVETKVWEINEAYREVYDRIYAIIRQPDGGACFGAFSLWGPGKTAKVQCDASAMFSPAMFRRFVVPALTAQCEYLDYSMFHLDGHECIPHLEHLLAIDALDAIEWTPDPNVPPGGDPHWYDFYRRILQAGKSVQAVGVQIDEIQPLIDAVGPAGLYILTSFADQAQCDACERMLEPYR